MKHSKQMKSVPIKEEIVELEQDLVEEEDLTEDIATSNGSNTEYTSNGSVDESLDQDSDYIDQYEMTSARLNDCERKINALEQKMEEVLKLIKQL